jgi:eukaryotic-like serine/threonine-protein kinase
VFPMDRTSSLRDVSRHRALAYRIESLTAGVVQMGRVVAHYRILRQLSAGGMGIVSKAEDTRLNRPVALKFLPPEFHSDRAALERFRREARAASALNHPNICTVYDIGENEGQPFIAMEYLEGQTLRERILSGPLKLEELLDAGTQIAEALQAAHSRKIIHRDIKPANIFLTESGPVKVMDFGLAKLGHEPSANGDGATAAATLTQELVTSPGTAPGTVAYMSPEQARGENLDVRSDLFSFGAVLYEMATGYVPFRGTTSAVVFDAILNKTPAAPAQLRPDLPPELERIISSALEKDRTVRCQSAAELKAALMRLRRGGDSSSSPAVSSRATSKRFAHWWMAAIAGIVLAAVAGLLMWRSSRAPVTPFRQMKISRLTTDGKTLQAAISGDGKYLAHVLSDHDRQSIMVRQLATGSEIQAVPPHDGFYSRLAFSPDNAYVMFIRYEVDVGSLYRVPVIGGTPQKLVTDVDTGPTFSPDGREIAYVRFSRNETTATLLAANIDGSAERVVSVRKSEGAIGQPAWSPDGNLIVWMVRVAKNDLFHDVLIASPIRAGKETMIPARHWYNTWGLQWLKNGAGLIISARENPKGLHQLWYVSYPGGESRPITNDLSTYIGVSTTADNSALVAVERHDIANLWVVENSPGAEPRQITRGINRADGVSGVEWTPDGHIVYASKTAEKWISGKYRPTAANKDG